jgi:hypothetical protein
VTEPTEKKTFALSRLRERVGVRVLAHKLGCPVPGQTVLTLSLSRTRERAIPA